MTGEPYTWNPVLYEAAIGTGMAVCTEHGGRHEWVMLDATEGFCMGLWQEEIARRVSQRLAEIGSSS